MPPTLRYSGMTLWARVPKICASALSVDIIPHLGIAYASML